MNPMIFQSFLISREIFNPGTIGGFIDRLVPVIEEPTKGKKTSYFELPCCFDIETTSAMVNGEKVAIMYEWSLGIGGLVIIGRTWEEFLIVLKQIIKSLDISVKRRLLIYSHNLQFEFQFLRKHFEWNSVFSIRSRTPLYALTVDGIEFRCSYLLSGYNLETLGKNLIHYKVEKAVGDLDYRLIRNVKTPLTYEEVNYCVSDVKVVMAYIQEMIENNGSIINIPLTKTGFVRRFCRDKCLKKDGEPNYDYINTIKGLTLEPEEYQQLKRAFAGGFVHANAFCVNKIMTEAESEDIISSYPTRIVANMFPMSKSMPVFPKTKEEFEKYLKKYCCLFDIKIEKLCASVTYENYISRSRCWNVEKAVINNGRIVSADTLTTTITEQDFMIIRKLYNWKRIRIFNMRVYRKGYLPSEFVESVLELYKDKTTLKGIPGKEREYLNKKEMLNSCYGMAVTDIVRDEITYDNNLWGIKSVNVETEINKYNHNHGRFLFYPWGVWICAYARVALFTAICEFGTDYIYSDTDSVKVINADKHREYFERYNKMITERLETALDHHGLPHDLIHPKTVKGEEKHLGIWDFDGSYERFKTIGAKRYMVEYSDDPRNDKPGDISITVSGLNKKVCVPWMKEKFGKRIFEAFSDELCVPGEYTGKMTHTYIDELREGEITDYLGKTAEYREESGIHLSETEYDMSLAGEFLTYLQSLEE